MGIGNLHDRMERNKKIRRANFLPMLRAQFKAGRHDSGVLSIFARSNRGDFMNRREFNSSLIGAGSLLALPLGIAKAKTVAEFKPGPISVVWYDEHWKLCETRRSGHWRDPATWVDGRIPGDWAVITIRHPVTLDQNVRHCLISLKDRGVMKWGRARIDFSFNTVLVENNERAFPEMTRSSRGSITNCVFTWAGMKNFTYSNIDSPIIRGCSIS
jgi:hypothetical protein